MNQDRLHRQVRALLAIAEDPAASPAERDTAMRRATTLMARHSITTLDPTTATTEEITTRTITIPGGTSTPSLAQAYGIHRVATAAGASTYNTDRRHWRRTPTQGPGVDIHIIGFPTDLNWLVQLTAALTTQTALDWATWRHAHAAAYRRLDRARRLTARNGYVLGYADGVADRLRAIRTQTITEHTTAQDTTTALTVRTRTQRVHDYLNTLNLKDGKTLPTNRTTAAAGRADGWSSGLGGPAHHLDPTSPLLTTGPR